MATRIEDSVHIAGNLTANTMSLPAGTVTNAMVNASAAIAATKLQHQHAITYSQIDGTAVVVTTGDGFPVYTVSGATATLVAVDVVCPDAPSGGDLAFTVDVKKAAQGSAAATVLSAVVTVDSAVADYEVKSGTISSASLTDGQTLLVVVAVSGSTGTQGQGLVVTITLREDAQ